MTCNYLLAVEPVSDLSNSTLATKVPELTVLLILTVVVLAAVWRIIGKVQTGQADIVKTFVEETRLTHSAHEVALAEVSARHEKMTDDHRRTLERVQLSLDRNSEMLGSAGNALERAAGVIGRLESQVERSAALGALQAVARVANTIAVNENTAAVHSATAATTSSTKEAPAS